MLSVGIFRGGKLTDIDQEHYNKAGRGALKPEYPGPANVNLSFSFNNSYTSSDT